MSFSSSSLTFPLNPSLHLKPYPSSFSFPLSLSFFSSSKLSAHSLSKSFISHSLNPSNNDREELRWLREEQRWLREEERWIREEKRWIVERESLLREITELKIRIQALEGRNSVYGGSVSVSETIANIAVLLQALKEKNLIADGGATVSKILLDDNSEGIEVEKKEIVEEVVKVLDDERKAEKEVKNERRSLRTGSEGAEVQALQKEALLRLGFYCGEEDMEFSSFSSGTERAVKTWQAASGIREDGIMTAELLEMLFMEEVTKSAGSDEKTVQKGNIPSPTDLKDSQNGAVTSVTEISEIQKTVVKEGGANIEVSQQRVFLIGENRWEDPSRLHSANGKAADGKTKDIPTKCTTCRGEGRLLCAECDGSGEPNIEPQFLEWVGEGTKCPYCEGLGYTICDACEGKTVT